MYSFTSNKRVQLTWSRVKDERIKYYRVYRGTKPDVKRSDIVVMEVEHSVVAEPIAVPLDVLKRVDELSFKMRYKNLMPDQADYPTKIFLNGILLDELNISYGVDVENGMLYLGAMVSDSDEITASYYVDGVRVYDTHEMEQPHVKYRGPDGRDRTENSIPSNISIHPEEQNGRIRVQWKDANTQGQHYYYRVEAVDENGNFSVLSVESSVFLREGLDAESYIIEQSYDGTSWTVVATTGEPVYYEYGIDTHPPMSPSDFTGKSKLEKGKGHGKVELNWKGAEAGISSVTGKYRVRSKSTLGVISSPSEVVGPIYLTSSISKYVIRRKIYDGSFPTYKGNDAITIGIVGNDVSSFTDFGVPDEETHAYALYAVDAADNVSAAATFTIVLGDASPPEKVKGLTASAHHYIIHSDYKALPAVTGLKVVRHSYLVVQGDIVAPHAITQLQVNASRYFM